MVKKILQKNFRQQPATGRVPLQNNHGTEHRGIMICSECRNIRYKKAWHNDAYPCYITKGNKEKVKYTLCPACKIIKEHLFAGEIHLNHFPTQYNHELLNLIHAFGERAKERDPQDRIITINKIENGYHILTTEDQLAVKLAKKIKQVFKATSLHVSYSPEPSRVSRIQVDFIESALP